MLTIPKWVKDGPVYVHMSLAFGASVKIHKKKENEEHNLHGDDKAPMDPDDYKSLSDACKKHYGFNLHHTQEYTSLLMNRMFSMLRNRAQGEAKPVKGLHTQEDTIKFGQKKNRPRPLSGTNLDLVDLSKPDDEEKTSYCPSRSSWLFIIAMEAMLRTFAGAGTYLVDDPERGNDKTLDVARELIEEHLAQCRSFVLDWCARPTPPQQGLIVSHVSRIDLSIRKKWWRLYR